MNSSPIPSPVSVKAFDWQIFLLWAAAFPLLASSPDKYAMTAPATPSGGQRNMAVRIPTTTQHVELVSVTYTDKHAI